MASELISPISYGLMALSSIGGAYSQAQAELAQGDYQRTMFRLNARMAEFQATEAISRGDREAAKAIRRGYRESAIARRVGRQTAGSQKAALAAQGIDVGSGSAADILQETAIFSELDQIEIQKNASLDALTIKNNAWREAWGLKTQASAYESEARMALHTAKRKSKNTLLTGGIRALTYGMFAYGKYKENYPTVKDKKDFSVSDFGGWD